MKIAYILFNDLTLLDFIGVYDAVLRLKTMNYIPEMHWDLSTTQGIMINCLFLVNNVGQ